MNEIRRKISVRKASFGDLGTIVCVRNVMWAEDLKNSILKIALNNITYCTQNRNIII